MIYKEEIKRWANCPEGTAVWYKKPNSNNWNKIMYAAWIGKGTYIVDDEYAELRKAHAEGKIIQYKSGEHAWRDRPSPSFNDDVSNYRIKQEAVYEWQWIVHKSGSSTFYMTALHYATIEETDEGIDGDFIIFEKYEPSKREKK